MGREFFVIVDGTTEVTKGGKRIASGSGGDFVGEIALLKTTKRTATERHASLQAGTPTTTRWGETNSFGSALTRMIPSTAAGCVTSVTPK